MKKKILITYASYGSGHKSIAEYIESFIDKDKFEVKIIDIMDYTSKFSNISVKMFDYVYKHRMEVLFNSLYEVADNKISIKAYKLFMRNIIYNKRIKKEFIEYNPNLVISTHFYGSNIACYFKKRNLINTKIMTIVTDYKIHQFWLSNKSEEEIFVVANELVKNEMIKRKCLSKKIYPFGLPINISKNKKFSKNEIYKKYNINESDRVVLFFAGGSNGSLGSLKYIKELMKIYLKNVKIILVCGKSEKLKIKANKLIKKHKNKNFVILGFVNNVYELLTISDFVITKPGGATITECLETKKAMLLLPGIGGQEKYNARYVQKEGYGIKSRIPYSFKKKFLKLLEKEELDKYKNNYEYINKNKSLEKISKLISKILK